MRSGRSPIMCLQQQNQKEEGLNKILKRNIQQKKQPLQVLSETRLKKKHSESEQIKQQYQNNKMNSATIYDEDLDRTEDPRESSREK